MRLPRRVPWSSIAELEQVCAWIYSDESDTISRRLAAERLAAWGAITPLPHAIESTHAILAASLQDASSQSSSSYLSLRQSYATAIIRLVNGLVDPMQLGAYARSISSIATQLGLPTWLVELRHAATHEDLPSLEILRQAANDSMTWLLNNYWLPTINPATPPSAQAPKLPTLEPQLKQYKDLLKATTRDASLQNTFKPEITRVLREVERWISGAKVAANLSLGSFDWDVGDVSTGERSWEEDPRERWALERLCDYLLDKGALVPLSKKKRISLDRTLSAPPPNIAIWRPLISHIQNLHPSFPAVIVSRMISHLTEDQDAQKPFTEGDMIALTPSAAETPKRDLSYELYLANWAKWFVDTYSSPDHEENSDSSDDLVNPKRKDVIISLAAGLGPTGQMAVGTGNPARILLTALCSDYPELQEIVVNMTQRPAKTELRAEWNEQDLDAMLERLQMLAPSTALATTQDIDMGVDGEVEKNAAAASTQDGPLELPPGWRKLSEHGWRAAPIGVFVTVQ
ncbi:Las1-domain-containing protein [Panus rudis PR-1116 ss-1]|nr:Las1-domain-containing protein [Panus rudis PR-1116 ss-1]